MAKIADGFAAIVSDDFQKKSRQYMEADLKRSGLEDSDLYATPLPNPPVPMHNPTWVAGAYRIPYFDRHGNQMEHMYRDRLFYLPEYEDQLKAEGMGKYKGPSHAVAAAHGVDSTMPYLFPGGEGVVGVVCEGEKKTVKAAERFGCPVLGIGGCWNWAAHRPRDAKGRPVGSLVVHPDILWWIKARGLQRLILVADPDIATNHQIATGYNGLASRLRLAFPELEVSVVNPGDKLDDLLVSDNRWGFKELLALEDVPDLELAQSRADLITQYDLTYRRTAQGDPIIHKNAHNVARLLELHPKWAGEVRFNLDERIYELYGQQVRDGYHEHVICATFNKHLHMPELTPAVVWSAFVRVAREHEYSPSQEDIKSCGKWDGQERMKYIFGEGRTPNEMAVAEALVCGYVKRVMNPGCFWRIMTILVGPQGVGKTGMAKWLAGGTERVSLFHPGEFKQLTKDTKLRLVNCSVALFDDVETFSHAELGHLKSIITQTHVVERVAYGRVEERFNRRGIMMGTGNDKAIIPDDPTGNTRFAVVELKEPQDFEWLNESRSQILAEAWTKVQAGWEPNIDFKELASKFTEKAGIQERLEEFLELLRDGKLNQFVLTAKSGNKFFKQEAFWQWSTGENYRPKDWERKDFGQRARALGIVYFDQNGGDTLTNGNRAKRVWMF